MPFSSEANIIVLDFFNFCVRQFMKCYFFLQLANNYGVRIWILQKQKLKMLLRQCDPDLLVMFVWLIPKHCGYTSMLCRCYSVLYITFHTRHIPVTLAGSNPVTLWFCMKVTVSVATRYYLYCARLQMCFFFSSRYSSPFIKIYLDSNQDTGNHWNQCDIGSRSKLDPYRSSATF